MDAQYRKYAPLWNKYRPVILKMMLDAAQEPQHYKFMRHEFQAMNDGKKASFGFNMLVSGTRALNTIRDSEIAQDLLNVLLQSPKASELLADNTYEVLLDKQLVLHVRRVSPESIT